jgi:hypothetical protein
MSSQVSLNAEMVWRGGVRDERTQVDGGGGWFDRSNKLRMSHETLQNGASACRGVVQDERTEVRAMVSVKTPPVVSILRVKGLTLMRGTEKSLPPSEDSISSLVVEEGVSACGDGCWGVDANDAGNPLFGHSRSWTT